MLTEQQEQEAKDEIAQVMDGLSKSSQKRVAKKLMKKYKTELKDNRVQVAKTKVDLALKNVELESLQELIRFLEGLDDWDDIILERNECSRLHHLKDAANNNRIINDENFKYRCYSGELDEFKNTFVVKHDWRSVLDGVEPDNSEIRLPYDCCAFEFRISGMTVIALATTFEGPQFTCLIESAGYWCAMPDMPNETGSCSIAEFVWAQIKAICVALDAEVACDEITRASYKLNEKRQKSGKAKIADYHVVDLSKRHRIANPSSGESGHKVRLHFRRGHWRHYEDMKTWIKWCLVGDPDLGFISKHYSI